MIFAIKFT
uniref:Uncharacterized protein n=1 Tax=Arundo donax TaxID=35708 RepID=A0A0A9FCJ2_ARUDO